MCVCDCDTSGSVDVTSFGRLKELFAELEIS
jgi:hypothetical protein